MHWQRHLLFAVGLVRQINGFILFLVVVPLFVPDGQLHQHFVRENLLFPRHPIKIGILSWLFIRIVRVAVEDLTQRFLIGANLVACKQLEGAQRHLIWVVVSDDLLHQPYGVVLLHRKVQALHLLRHEGDICLLLIVPVDVVGFDLDLLWLWQLVVHRSHVLVWR